MVFISCKFISLGSSHDFQHTVAVELRQEMLFRLTGRSAWKFAVRDDGKPYISEESISFSISHTDGCVLCAVSLPDYDRNNNFADAVQADKISDERIYSVSSFMRHGEIGCDVENCFGRTVLSQDRAAKIADRYFTEREKSRFNAERNSLESFYRIWTLKESIVKATGEGIGALRKADVYSIPNAHRVSLMIENEGNCFLGAVSVI